MEGRREGGWEEGGREDRRGGGGIDGRERTIYVRKVFMQLKVCS